MLDVVAGDGVASLTTVLSLVVVVLRVTAAVVGVHVMQNAGHVALVIGPTNGIVHLEISNI